MAINLINIGSIANDGTGDDLREAFVKVNSNFEELDLRDNEKTSVSNLGTGQAIFDSIVNYDIKLKTLLAGPNVQISADTAGNITIGADTSALTTIDVESEAGELSIPKGSKLTIHGAEGIDTYIENGLLYIKSTDSRNLQSEPEPTLGVNLDANNKDIININTLRANNYVGNVTGNVTGLINGVDPLQVVPYFDNYWDFGNMSATVTSILDWVTSTSDVDLGTFNTPETKSVDLGGFVTS